MNAKLTAVVLLAGLLGACEPPPPPPPAPAPAPTPAPVAPSAEVSRDHHVVTIRNVNCSALLSLSEEDRAAASMFYMGYTSSRRGQRKIDVAEIDGLEAAALGYCTHHPQAKAAVAFNKAFHDNGR